MPTRKSSEVKIVVLGSAGVGKSALCTQFVHGTFDERYDPTIEDTYRRVIEDPSGQPVLVEVVDTAGTEQFVALRDLYLRSGDAFLLVYSVDRMASLEALQPLVQALKDNSRTSKGEKPVCLVGNKCDLEEDRQVSLSMALAKADSWDLPPPLETSARLDQYVQEAFFQLIEAVASNQGIGKDKSRQIKKNKEDRKCLLQ